MSNRLRSIEAAVAGAVIGAGLLGAIGAPGGNTMIGTAAGFILGAIVGWSAYCGRIHRITVGAIFYALIGCFVGPAIDDFGGISAIPFACIGAVVGWLGWRFLIALLLAWIGAILAHRPPGPPAWSPQPQTWSLIVFVIGAWLGTYIGVVLERHFAAVPAVLLPPPASSPSDATS